jgi:hypothetical protein
MCASVVYESWPMARVSHWQEKVRESFIIFLASLVVWVPLSRVTWLTLL